MPPTPTKASPATLAKFIRRVRRRDRLARWLITAVGIGVIGVVILIIVSIAAVAFPLFSDGETKVHRDVVTPGGAPERVFGGGCDEYLETAYLIDRSGAFRFFTVETGEHLDTNIVSGATGNLVSAKLTGQDAYDLLWEDGTARRVEVWFRPEFRNWTNDVGDTETTRTITHRLYTNVDLPTVEATDTAATNMPPVVSSRLAKDDGEPRRVDLHADGSVRYFRFDDEGDLERDAVIAESGADHILLQGEGDTLFVAKDRVLERWNLRRRKPSLTDAYTNDVPITAVAFGNSEISVFVGGEDGSLITVMPIPRDITDENGSTRTVRVLGKVHTLSAHGKAVTQLVPARTNKSILSGSAGSLQWDYMTNERALRRSLDFVGFDDLAEKAGDEGLMISLSARGNGVFAATPSGELAIWETVLPHPEINRTALFGKVHYENKGKPIYEWQSSSGDDAYEEKYSIVPLVLGTLKATFYAMLFATPIAILAALYSSQFMNPSLRNKIKPMVEIMAAVPSVVVGFLAAFWLAPILVTYMPAFFASVLVIPLTIWVAVFFWRKGDNRWATGREIYLLIPVLILGILLSVFVGGLVERSFMTTDSYPNGNFARWLSNEHGMTLDPRNGILISFALGFAVIPIIFTLSEDAMSRVPRSLNAASLALGASRWQTAWKVVLPSASPGIFAALMIGFGRAIGETMIVLMAAGNTPIMSLNPFNGMRTLSANIATEVGEAPVGSTHYRVLFLSAVLLFVMTFLVNTVAELVRMRLRKKFANY